MEEEREVALPPVLSQRECTIANKLGYGQESVEGVMAQYYAFG